MLLDQGRRGKNGFLLAGITFHETMDAVWELDELVSPHVAGIDNTNMRRDVSAAMEGLSPSEMKDVSRLLEIVTDAQRDRESDHGGQDEKDHLAEFQELYARLGGNTTAFIEIMASVRRAGTAPGREPLLRGALLAMALGALDVLVAQIARSYYRAHPEALGDEPKFSLRDLQEFETLQDARDEAIAKKVDSLGHGDLAEWSKWFDKQLGLKLPNLAFDYDVLFEVLQRRHLIIHSGGRVSRLYLARMKRITEELPPLGQLLTVDAEYLRRALDEIETLGDLLTAGAWSKCLADDEVAAAHDLYLRSYDLMLDGRWRVVKALCAVGKRMDAAASTSAVFHVNVWLAHKRLGEFGDVVHEVKAWDTGAMEMRFRLARAALLDDLDGAFAMADMLLQRGDLEVEDLREWPLLLECREDPRYGPLCEKYSDETDDAGASGGL